MDTLEKVKINPRVNWDSGPQCQSKHWYSPRSCTVRAAYRVVNRCDGKSSLWCAARHKEFMQTADIRICCKCKKPLIECWRVSPL